ncbi:hypothetical protein [Streptomyces globisporus]|uniref:hypothetical protein n=1 Tax=Streptomyces globisporus TaxID=1908 RepID=UPI00131B557A|nr:hypothetical protein [Streptomyces globisporus]
MAPLPGAQVPEFLQQRPFVPDDFVRCAESHGFSDQSGMQKGIVLDPGIAFRVCGEHDPIVLYDGQ